MRNARHKKGKKMKTLICRTCGCSLVRLGVSKEDSVAHHHKGEEYRFCCQGCVDVFITDPEKYLKDTNDLIVCPTCLAEKPRQRSATFTYAGQEVPYCRCPYCAEVFQKNPDFYIARLEGTIPHEGVLDHEGGGVRPA